MAFYLLKDPDELFLILSQQSPSIAYHGTEQSPIVIQKSHATRICVLQCLHGGGIHGERGIFHTEVQRSSRELLYSCPTCMGSAPVGNSDWEMDCSPPDGGVAVGVAALSSLDDLDYLICTAPPELLLNINDGAQISDDRICSDVISGRPFPVTGLWADQESFRSPTSARYQCREIISGERWHRRPKQWQCQVILCTAMPFQLDTARCTTAQPSYGAVPGVDGTGHVRLLCPPHMVAAAIFWGPSGAHVTCCLLY
ncbi:uncharacterized protein [Penaeus vannamei]|uniref:uncharacterized protein n=1 Tax=Penaeus vannamei TaxID=6689 RepID=UPI00387F8BDE